VDNYSTFMANCFLVAKMKQFMYCVCMKDTRQIEQFEYLFKLLANNHRLAIIKLLKKETDLSVWYISGKIGSNVKATSKHLRILFEEGIIERDQHLNEAVYFLSRKNSRIVRYIIKQF